jgi:PilZ domain-containing protein
MSSWFARLLGKSQPPARPPALRPPRPAAPPTKNGRPAPAAAAKSAAAIANDRRSTRVVARVHVALTRDAGTMTALTAVVNDQGCLVVAPEDWPTGTPCRLKHMDTGRTARARIVWNGGLDELGSYKLGFEFTEEVVNFWAPPAAKA